MGVDWASVRAEFPALQNWTYLNTATYGQVPRRGVEAIAAHFADRDERASSNFLDWYDEADVIRWSVANLIHASPDDIGFIQNSSTAMGLIAGGIDWKRGDNVVTLADEFPNCLYLPALVERHGVEFREAPWERFYESIDERTRLVAISEVNYASGLRPPLAEISKFLHERGVLLYVDGTQSVGALRFDVRESQPDLLSVHAYKWMCSPTGVGFMYVAPSLRAKLLPSVAGWRTDKDWHSVDNLRHGMPILKESAERYEGGGLQFGLLHAMGAVADWMMALGTDEIERRVMDLSRCVREKLVRLGAEAGESRGQIVAVKFPGVDSSKLARELREKRVIVAARHGYFRVAPHFYNDAGDLDRLEEEVRAVLKASRER